MDGEVGDDFDAELVDCSSVEIGFRVGYVTNEKSSRLINMHENQWKCGKDNA